jgi:hypothetical protein
MANTFVALATVTVGSGGAANIEFTSIPATYTDLLVKFSVRTDYASNRDYVSYRLNGSSSNYSIRWLATFDNASPSSGNASSQSYGGLNVTSSATATSNTFGNGEIYIPNYTGSTNKSISLDSVAENNSSTLYALSLSAGLWSDTSAITSISLYPGGGAAYGTSGNFVQYSTATLYGIKNS